MNHFIVIFTVAALALGAITGSAFLPALSSSSPGTSWASRASHHRGPSTHLQSSLDKDRIKKAGAGLTTVSPGDLCLYDPNENGKLQGSSTLMERVQLGASFGRGVGGRDDDAPSSDGNIGVSPSIIPTTTETKPNKVTTNLTKVLGELDSRVRGQGRSQY
ncbi:hypothetical protein ACHAWU_006917 [Discostella pseudostelligera]|uniref:Secreted protein n=1 Tax=Discostella pseudostelligera TaxID=259834 RepID=A0ABD3N3N1_9STRA